MNCVLLKYELLVCLSVEYQVTMRTKYEGGGRRQGRQQQQKEVGRQHQGMDRPGVRHVPEGSRERGKMEETGCEVICGAPTTLAVKVLMKVKKKELCAALFWGLL